MDKLKILHDLLKDKQFDELKDLFDDSVLSTDYGRLIHAIFVSLTEGKLEKIEINCDPSNMGGLELSDVGLYKFIVGDLNGAKFCLEKAVNKPDIDEATWARLAAVYYTLGRHDDARYCWERSLEIKSDRPEVLYNLGVLYLNNGNYEKAIEYFNRTLAIDENYLSAEEKRTLAFAQLERVDELIEDYYKKIEKDKNPGLYIKLANVLDFSGRYAEASSVLEEGVGRFKDDLRLRFALIEVLLDGKRIYKAGVLLKEWLDDLSWLKEEENKDDITNRLKLKLNECRIEAGFLDTAKTDLEAMEPSYPEWYSLMSKIYMENNEGDKAKSILEEGLSKFPDSLVILNSLSFVLSSIGEKEKLKEVNEKILSINPAAIVQSVESKGYNATDNEIAALYNVLNSISLPISTRASAGFELHRVLDKKKRYDEAFEVLQQANELVKKTLDYDWKDHRVMIERTKEVFTEDLVEKLLDKGYDNKKTAIFVLGMPRSGTTLTEQILGSHSSVYPAGELGFVPRLAGLMNKVVKRPWPTAMLKMDENLLKSAGNYYIGRVEKLDNKHSFFVDKLPHNFDYIGLILLMIKNVKIIHLNRNDLDVALSNYQQNFAAAHGTMGFAFDLEWIGHMLNDHREIMNHWRMLFKDKIYELDYERLTKEPEPVIREMLEFCELKWEDSVLEFYATKRPVKTASISQVRQKIYTSAVEKWRRYEKQLEPVRRILNEGFRSIVSGDAEQYEDVVSPLGFLAFTRG